MVRNIIRTNASNNSVLGFISVIVAAGMVAPIEEVTIALPAPK